MDGLARVSCTVCRLLGERPHLRSGGEQAYVVQVVDTDRWLPALVA